MAMNEEFPLALKPGTILGGKYLIERVLGQGGFGITYKVQDTKLDEYFAIKEFFPEGLAHRSGNSVIPYAGQRKENFEYGKTTFLEEAKTLAQFIKNRGVVRIYRYFEENNTAYFVMNYIEGKNLDDYIKEHGGRISMDDAIRLLVPVMSALAIVHKKGIIHRDITPDNIYIQTDGSVILIDFGAARFSLGDKNSNLDVILKPGFAPKEQYSKNGSQGPYTDIYSLGATFYFAITGERPQDSFERMLEDELLPPSAMGVDISPTQEAAIMHAMAVRAEDRFQSMEQFKAALLDDTSYTQSLANANANDDRQDTSNNTNKGKSKGAGIIAAVIVIVLIAGILGAAYYFNVFDFMFKEGTTFGLDDTSDTSSDNDYDDVYSVREITSIPARPVSADSDTATAAEASTSRSTASAASTASKSTASTASTASKSTTSTASTASKSTASTASTASKSTASTAGTASKSTASTASTASASPKSTSSAVPSEEESSQYEYESEYEDDSDEENSYPEEDYSEDDYYEDDYSEGEESNTGTNEWTISRIEQHKTYL